MSQQHPPPPAHARQHMPYSQPPGPPRQGHPTGPPPPQAYPPPPGPQMQYQPYPPHAYPPPPPNNLPPPPPHDDAQHHAYYQQQMQLGAPPPPPPPGYGGDGRSGGGPTYGHFPPPQQQSGGGHPQQHQQPANERVKVIRGSAAGRRDSTDSDGPGGHPNGVHRKEKRRRIVVGGREPSKERFHKTFMETRERLTVTNRILLANPSDSGEYALKVYPFSLERAALLSQIEHDEENGLDSAQTTYDEEKNKIEDEWKKGKERIRERLLESLEERRKKAREEMASDGALADVPTFDPPAATRSSTRDRKPPPFTLAAPHPFGAAGEDMVSPFPLPLTSYAGGTGAWSAKGKRQKGVGAGGLTLGKAITALQGLKETEIDSDLGEVKKAAKRKRGNRQAPSTQSTTTGDSAAIIPQSPTSLALAALNMTRDDLARHTDQMRCFLSASAPPIHTLPQNHIIHPYPTHPSSSLTPVKSETPDPPQVLPTRPSMDAVLERGERRKKDLKRLYSTNSIPSDTTTNTNPFDDHPTNNNSPNTTPEDLPATSGSGNNNNMTSATPATQSDNALPNPSILYPVAPTPLDARTIAKGASRSSSVCSSLAYQQDVFYSSRPPSVAPSASLSHPSVRRSQSIASQVSGLHSGVGDDLEDADVGQVHAESVDEILGLAPAPSRQYNPEATDAVSSGQQNPGISLTMQTPVKVPPQLVASGSTPYQPVPMPSSSVTRVGAYPSSSPVYKYQPATSPAGPRGYVQYAAAPPSVGPSFPSAAHAVPAEPSAAFAGPSVERGRSTHIRIPASNGYSLRPAASSHPSSSPLASRSTRSLEMSSEDEEEEEPESEDDGFQNASNRAMAEMRMPPHHSPVRGLAAAQSPTRSIRSPTAYMDGGRMPDVREMYDDISHERHMDSGTMDEDERTEAGRGQSPTAHDAAVSSQEAAPAPLGLPFALNESSAPAVDLGSEEGEENSQPAEASALQPGFHFVPPLPKTNSQSAEDGVVKQDPETGARGLEDDGFSNFFSSSPVHQRSRQNARFSTARASGSGSDLLSRVIESKTAKRGVRPQSTNNASPTKGIFPAVPTTPRRDTRLRTPPPPSERVPKDPSLENEEDKLLKEMDPTVAAAVSALTSLSPMRTPVSHAALHMSPAPPRSSDLAQYKHSLGPQSPFRTPGRTPSGRAFDYYDYLGDGVGGSADDSATKSMLGTGLLPRTPATPMTGGIFGSHNLYQSPSLPSPGWRRY
ncbi:hypothetical protein FRB90_008419 [Tulasnella sp. 427]|nr:hypothetical protein FRB90_008419 [Tulasnella sp. 427]